ALAHRRGLRVLAVGAAALARECSRNAEATHAGHRRDQTDSLQHETLLLVSAADPTKTFPADGRHVFQPGEASIGRILPISEQWRALTSLLRCSYRCYCNAVFGEIIPFAAPQPALSQGFALTPATRGHAGPAPRPADRGGMRRPQPLIAWAT